MRRINCRDDADHRPPYQMCHTSAAYGIWRHQHKQTHTHTLANSMPYAMVNCHAHQQIACKTFTLNFDKEQLMMIKKERGCALRVNYSRMRVWCLLLLPPLPLAPLHLSFYWPVFVWCCFWAALKKAYFILIWFLVTNCRSPIPNCFPSNLSHSTRPSATFASLSRVKEMVRLYFL